MGRPITILVGTMTGTAELVADEVQDALGGIGFDVTILLMDDLDASAVSDGAYLICSSTYGSGDVPDNARAFFESLEGEKPDLSKVVYGLIALGDRTYKATFCQGGMQFDRLFTALGARRAGEVFQHDASSGTMPEEVAVEWVVPWAETALAPMLEAA